MAERDGALAPGVLAERPDGDWGVFVRSTREYERFRSPRQAIEVHETAAFGKLLRLDGRFVPSERDGFCFRENLVHVAAVAHPAPERALVVGGGDGGAAAELLGHPTIRSVTIAERDLAVVDLARKYLAAVHRGSLEDPRVSLRVGDERAFVRETAERYDLIVLDAPDPAGAEAGAGSPEFYRACASRLTPSGALALPIASPVADAAHVRDTLVSLRAAFPVVAPYLASIPLLGGMWVMACCSNGLDPRRLSTVEVDRRVAQRGLEDLRYYNGDTHRAGFALPNFVRAIVT